MSNIDDLDKYISNPENTVIDGRHFDNILYEIMDKLPNVRDIKLGFIKKDNKLDIEGGLRVFIYATSNNNLPSKIGKIPVIIKLG